MSHKQARIKAAVLGTDDPADVRELLMVAGMEATRKMAGYIAPECEVAPVVNSNPTPIQLARYNVIVSLKATNRYSYAIAEYDRRLQTSLRTGIKNVPHDYYLSGAADWDRLVNIVRSVKLASNTQERAVQHLKNIPEISDLFIMGWAIFILDHPNPTKLIRG